MFNSCGGSIPGYSVTSYSNKLVNFSILPPIMESVLVQFHL